MRSEKWETLDTEALTAQSPKLVTTFCQRTMRKRLKYLYNTFSYKDTRIKTLSQNQLKAIFMKYSFSVFSIKSFSEQNILYKTLAQYLILNPELVFVFGFVAGNYINLYIFVGH